MKCRWIGRPVHWMLPVQIIEFCYLNFFFHPINLIYVLFCLQELSQVCLDGEAREVLKKIQQQVDVVKQTAERISSSAEVYGRLYIYVSLTPYFVFGFWSLLATKLQKYKNITYSLFTFCKAKCTRRKKY